MCQAQRPVSILFEISVPTRPRSGLEHAGKALVIGGMICLYLGAMMLASAGHHP